MKLGILIVHGMGTQTEKGFHKSTAEMISRISRELRALGADPREIAWERGYWGNILQEHEDKLFARLAGSRLDWMKVRRFVIDNLGDAVAYQRVSHQPKDFYRQIHACLHGKIVELRKQAGDADVPLIIMAHSLGCYIVSNYIWDRQSLKRKDIADTHGQTPFERMETLSSILTFGCNIAILSLALDPYVGIAFPPAELPPAQSARARWLNFYDPDDVLGYPIKPLCDEYRTNAEIEDHCIRVGGIFSSWNPLSHDRYWTASNFIRPAARQIANLLEIRQSGVSSALTPPA